MIVIERFDRFHLFDEKVNPVVRCDGERWSNTYNKYIGCNAIVDVVPNKEANHFGYAWCKSCKCWLSISYTPDQ